MLAQRHTFEINYLYRNDPRVEIVEAQSDRFPAGSAARHLLHVHEGGEAFQAAADDDHELLDDEQTALDQAGRAGITDIRVTRLEHTHNAGTTPGHYQQP